MGGEKNNLTKQWNYQVFPCYGIVTVDYGWKPSISNIFVITTNLAVENHHMSVARVHNIPNKDSEILQNYQDLQNILGKSFTISLARVI